MSDNIGNLSCSIAGYNVPDLESMCVFKSSTYSNRKLPKTTIIFDDVKIMTYRKKGITVVGVKSMYKILWYLKCYRYICGMMRNPVNGRPVYESLRFGPIALTNIVSNFKIDEKFTKNLVLIAHEHPFDVIYNPASFPAVIYHQKRVEPKFTANIFATGRINIAGLKNTEDIEPAMRLTLSCIYKSVHDPTSNADFYDRYLSVESDLFKACKRVKKKKSSNEIREEFKQECNRFYNSTQRRKFFNTSEYIHTKETFRNRMYQKHNSYNTNRFDVQSFKNQMHWNFKRTGCIYFEKVSNKRKDDHNNMVDKIKC
jgi:TATA-box binding protein (TBP) (component of TFIID and TFIIIB)